MNDWPHKTPIELEPAASHVDLRRGHMNDSTVNAMRYGGSHSTQAIVTNSTLKLTIRLSDGMEVYYEGSLAQDGDDPDRHNSSGMAIIRIPREAGQTLGLVYREPVYAQPYKPTRFERLKMRLGWQRDEYE